MKFTRIAVLLFVLISSLLAVPNVDADLQSSGDGTVYDTVLKVHWLANANLAGMPDTPEAKSLVSEYSRLFGVTNPITPGGSMSYQTALLWVDFLNGWKGGLGYLGHTNWQLPTTPRKDPGCLSLGPHGNDFGFGCLDSDMGSLFYSVPSLGLHHPNTAVPIQDNTVGLGPFHNFQPYLYWTKTIDAKNPKAGYHTFSFDTGWAGANVSKHYMYVLPMIKGQAPRLRGYKLPDSNGLEVSFDVPQTVYDPVTKVTWLADANLAASNPFDLQYCTDPVTTALCINHDGSMTHKNALNWIEGMNDKAYLGQTNWQLPPDTGMPACGGFGCLDTPLGDLYYYRLGSSPGVSRPDGTPVVPTPMINVGPFQNIQPYLYWSSCKSPYLPGHCQDQNGNPATEPAPGFDWSFSFGNGFEGTDVKGNDLYVMVYYPETPLTTAHVSGRLLSSGWYVGPTDVSFTPVGDSTGVSETDFSFDLGMTWTDGTNVPTLTANAIYNILYRSTDGAGNVETPKSIIVRLDSVPPVTTVTTRPHIILGVFSSLEVDFHTSDNLSGVAATETSFDHGATWRTGNVLFLGCGGTHRFLVRSIDVAGNVGGPASITLSTPLCGAFGGP